MITVTLAPTDFANDNPFVTACSANSEPSVGMRICRYMLHLSIARAIAQISELCVQFLEQTAIGELTLMFVFTRFLSLDLRIDVSCRLCQSRSTGRLSGSEKAPTA